MLFSHGFLENTTVFFGFFPGTLLRGQDGGKEECCKQLYHKRMGNADLNMLLFFLDKILRI